MSSSISPASPDPSSSSPSSNDQRNNNNGGASSNLYLVTFLATLFLLLFVSCAIVLRSYILRRRYQRRLDEAMAAGMLLAPRTQGSKRKRLGAKPALFDTCLADGGVTWERIKPLSAQPIFVKRKYKDGRIPKDGVIISGPQLLGGGGVVGLDVNANDPTNLDPSLPNASTSTPATTSRTPLRLLTVPFAFLRSLWWNPSAERHNNSPFNNRTPNEPDLADDMEVAVIEPEGPATNDVPSSPGGLSLPQTNMPTAPGTGTGSGAMTPLTYKVRVEMLQVSVLIAMPSPNRTIRKNKHLYRPRHTGVETDDEDDEDEDEDEEEPLPELVFGVTRVNYRQPKAGTANSNSNLANDSVGQQKLAVPVPASIPPEEL